MIAVVRACMQTGPSPVAAHHPLDTRNTAHDLSSLGNRPNRPIRPSGHDRSLVVRGCWADSLGRFSSMGSGKRPNRSAHHRRRSRREQTVRGVVGPIGPLGPMATTRQRLCSGRRDDGRLARLSCGCAARIIDPATLACRTAVVAPILGRQSEQSTNRDGDRWGAHPAAWRIGPGPGSVTGAGRPWHPPAPRAARATRRAAGSATRAGRR